MAAVCISAASRPTSGQRPVEMGERKGEIPHVLVFPLPLQGHTNPMLQFAKRLLSKHVKVSLVTTIFLGKSLQPQIGPIKLELISDGYDDTGWDKAGGISEYFHRFRTVGRQSLLHLFHTLRASGYPANCLVYDSFLPWALDVARQVGALAACFWTQSSSVNFLYYQVHRGILSSPPSDPTVSFPFLPDFRCHELPFFISSPEILPEVRKLVMDQFTNLDEADCVLCNTFEALETEVLLCLKAIFPIKTIGPAIPSFYLDKRVEGDCDYGISFWDKQTDMCRRWLDDRGERSVVYVSFGSVLALKEEQMREIAWGLVESQRHFLWVVREGEKGKLPDNWVAEKGLMVSWCPQLEVLSHSAVGCFFTHCGWSSTLEGLCIGVPMIGFPFRSDQPTNGKYVEEVWRVGVRLRADESGFVGRDEIKRCIGEVMGEERRQELTSNSRVWRDLAVAAVGGGGSSDRDLEAFAAAVGAAESAADRPPRRPAHNSDPD